MPPPEIIINRQRQFIKFFKVWISRRIHGDEITESSLAQRYGFDPNAEMPENARLAKQRELSEEYLAAKAEEMADQLRAGIESAEVSKWRKFLAKIRRALEKFLPREKLNELDDRTLTDLLRKSLANAGYQIDVDGFGFSDASGRASAGGVVAAEKLNRTRDLETAKLMRDFGKDMRTVKLATGFELHDGQWKFYIPDLKIKEADGDINQKYSTLMFLEGRLGDIVDAPELFAAYPQLADYWVYQEDLPRGVLGAFVAGDNDLFLARNVIMDKIGRAYAANDETRMDNIMDATRRVLIHEVQHAIQKIEGFARGGSARDFNGKYSGLQSDAEKLNREIQKSPSYRKYRDLTKEGDTLFLNHESDKFIEWHKKNKPEVDRLFALPEVQEILNHRFNLAQKYDPFDDIVRKAMEDPASVDWDIVAQENRKDIVKSYRSLAGEVESRNMEMLAGMTEEESRKQLFDDTADVPANQRIYLKYDGSWTSADIAEFEDGVRFVDVNVDQHLFDGLDKKQSIQLAKKIIKLRFLNKIVGNKNKAFLNGDGVGEFLYPSTHIKDDIIYKAKMRTSSELDNLLDAGTRMPDKPDGVAGHTHQNVKNFSYFDVVFKIGNRYYDGTINIINNKRGKLFKDITQIEDITDVISDSYGKNPKFEYIRDVSGNNINASVDLSSEDWKKSGRGSVDLASQLDPALEDNMIEALLAPVKSANGDLAALLEGGALKYLTDNGFPDVGNNVARYLVMEARDRLNEIKRKQSRKQAFDNFRQMDPLFDFIAEFAGNGESMVINPGEKYVDSDVSGILQIENLPVAGDFL